MIMLNMTDSKKCKNGHIIKTHFWITTVFAKTSG